MAAQSPEYDVVVIGGGIHGVGIAQAAAVRGHSTLVIERERLAAGTSSRSSKLIHGGLRYLESGQLSLVRESLRERRYLLRIAPSLVHWVAFHIPVYADSRRASWKVRAGLGLYALLAGPRKKSAFRSLPRASWSELDGMRTAGLRAVFRYWDAQTDDAALTAAVMRSAEHFGARLACPAEMVWAESYSTGYRIGYRAESGDAVVTTRVLVNAAGPWINLILARIRPQVPSFPMQLVQGTHVVFDGVLKQGIYYTEAPADGRAVFVMPYQGRVLVGTTETAYGGSPGAEAPTAAEIAYLHETYSHSFPARDGAPAAAFAGLRVLPAGHTSVNARSRETTLICEPSVAPRLVTIAGGKLTGYRATAERVLAKIARQLPPPTMHTPTHEISIVP